MSDYHDLLENEIFRGGEQQGRLRTALTVLTDMLIQLNSLEIYYQKPGSKSISPKQISELREKIETVKNLVHQAMQIET